MRLRLYVIFTLFFVFQGFGQATDLIISEYVEGSSNNKYIEIYNGTTASINLANYELRLYANGAAAPSNTQVLSGTLAVGATMVYRNSAATIYAGTSTISAVCNFNGNDAVALFKISTSSFVDIMGNIGCDPGASWTSTNTTLDRTLIRNANVCSGVTSDPADSPCIFPTLASEWTQLGIDNVSNLGSHTMNCIACVPGLAPTSVSTNPNTNPFCTSAGITFSAGNGTNHLVVVSTAPVTATPTNGTGYTANTTFGSGTALAANQFVVFNGTGTNFTVTGLTFNTTYHVAIFEFNRTSVNCDESYNLTPLTFSFTTLNNCSTPQIRSILADACSSVEGLDELVLIENGANPLSINDIRLNFPSGGSYCNTTCGTNTLGNNPSYVSQLNATAGCTLFAYADPIPAGATIIVFTGQTPSYVFDYSTQCPSTEVFYVIFCNNTSTTGRFANSGTGTRTLNANFAGTSESVTYEPSLLGSDGSFIDFDDAGNPTYRTEANCIYPLGVELVNWNAAWNEKSVLLTWTTLIENNSGKFHILRSENGSDFVEIGSVFAQGISHQTTHYAFEDQEPSKSIAYYKLVQVDRDGQTQESKLVSVNPNWNEVVARYENGYIQLSEVLLPGESYQLFNSNGQIIQAAEMTETKSTIATDLKQGLYFLTLTRKSQVLQTVKCLVTH